MNIYTDLSTIKDAQPKNLNPLLSYHWLGLSKDEIFSGDRNSASPFCLTEEPEGADYFVLPLNWSNYVWNRKAKMPEALRFAETARRHSKDVIVWYKGDLVPNIPFGNNVLFLPGIVRNRMKLNHRACPVFIDDPKPHYGDFDIGDRKKKEKPSVGFCGYGSISAVKLGWSIANGIYGNLKRRFTVSGYDSFPIVPGTMVRNQAMQYLKRDARVETRFVVRSRYTSRRSADPAAENSQAFYRNIYETDYTLCVRGFGNWSYRFYETLACGRIPVFVDTDCVLPLESRIDWRKYCVWIDRSERHLIAEKLLDFHASLSDSDFADLQLNCRKLWNEHLTLRGFCQNASDYLESD